jgi:hypothetical protein
MVQTKKEPRHDRGSWFFNLFYKLYDTGYFVVSAVPILVASETGYSAGDLYAVG